VVGAGFTGMSAALELAERGYKVIVVEGERVGWGASGATAGQLLNGYSRRMLEVRKHYGAEAEAGVRGDGAGGPGASSASVWRSMALNAICARAMRSWR